MPGFDGTGPQGKGPLTGRGNGFCVIPVGRRNKVTHGISGMKNKPVNISYPYRNYYKRLFIPGCLYPYGIAGYTGIAAGYLNRRKGRQVFPGGMGMGKRAGKF